MEEKYEKKGDSAALNESSDFFFYRSVRPHTGNKKNGDSHIPRAQVQVWGWHTDLCEHKQLLLLPMDAKHTYHTHTYTP